MNSIHKIFNLKSWYLAAKSTTWEYGEPSKNGGFWEEVGPSLPFEEKAEKHHEIREPRGSEVEEDKTRGKGRSIDPSWVDIEMMGSWLRKCDDEHGVECCKPLGIDPSNLSRPKLLLDIRRKCVTVAESDHRYACLSYVWGGTPTLKARRSNIGDLMVEGSLKTRHSEIPKTIRNAIGLVEQLGIDYLWVDALCIVQDDTESKHVQIQAMAGIYANSYVTIIAGNGWDSDHGIRGIPGITEPRQLSVFSKMDFEENIQPYSSIWYSRGWTFQECLLSPRKIMFQYQGSMWECNTSAWNEASLLPDAIPSCSKKPEITISPWRDRGKITSSPDIEQYVDFAHDYTMRKLSYAEDGLPAITGLLSLMGPSFHGPFIGGLPGIFFDEALLWQPAEVMQRRRAANFADSPPSWSWIGWEGEIMKQEWLDHFSYLRSRRPERKGILSNSKMRPLSSSSQPVLQVSPLVTWYYSEDREPEYRLLVRQNLPRRTQTLEEGGVSGRELPGIAHHAPTSEEKPTLSSPVHENTTFSVSARYLFCQTKICVFWKLQLYNTWTLNPGKSVVDSPRVALGDDSGNCAGSLIIDLFDENIKDVEEFELVAISKGKVVDHGIFYYDDNKRFCQSCALNWGGFELDGRTMTTNRIISLETTDRTLQREEKIIEFYYVLWIGWEDGVAYRRGLGRVLKEYWDREATEEIDLVLG